MGERRSRSALSGRQVLVSGLLAAALVAGAYGWTRAGTPASPNDFTIAMTDYAFAPSHMVWRVGDTVTITLMEKSEANPEKPHEFMVGQTPRTEETVFGIHQEDGFETPFFDGVTIDIVAGSGMNMLMAGGATLTGLPPMQVMSPGPMEMEMEEEEEMTGFMPVVGPAGTLTFSFVVPDKPGEWTYGCFQQDGQHFLNGMKGTITILPKAA
jgi:plastocyanin